MFLGASLDPEYFSEKVNLFVALGPATKMSNVKVDAFKDAAKIWRELEYLTTHFHAYNLFNFNWLEETATTVLLCNQLFNFCDKLVHWFSGGNQAVDNMKRWDVVMKDYPAGNGYQNLVFFMQAMENDDTWLRYDYGAIVNMDKYGQVHPPAVPLDQMKVPTGLFVGTVDNLATVADNNWLAGQLSDGVLKHHGNYLLDHLSFSLARDMSYFTVEVMRLVNKYATNSIKTETMTDLSDDASLFITN